MKRSFMKLGAFAAMMAMIGAPTAGMGSKIASHQNADAVKGKEIKPSVASEERIGTGREGYRRPNSSFAGNQRQYRKKCRQNPCRYGSKKHRSKN